VFIVSLVPYLFSTSPLVFLSYSLSSNIYYTLSHIIPYFWLLLTSNSSMSPTLLSSTFFYVQLLVHCDATRLFPFSTLHPLVYIPFLPSTPILSLFVILLLLILLLLYLSPVLLLLFLLSYESNGL